MKNTNPKTAASNEDIMSLLPGIPLTRQVLANALETADDTQRRFLYDLLVSERESRYHSRINRLTRAARFPSRKTFTGYDWSAITWPPDWGRKNLETLDFINQHEDLVLYGDVGCGKTHLAIALGYAACQKNITVKFYTATSLIGILRLAQENHRLEKELTNLGKTGLIIIDELGYLPIDKEGARLLYQVIANAYENQSIIYTSNLEFSGWGTVLGDTQMAAAIIDRTVHHGRILRFTGTSYRVTHATMK